jgi:hypothetical protein
LNCEKEKKGNQIEKIGSLGESLALKYIYMRERGGRAVSYERVSGYQWQKFNSEIHARCLGADMAGRFSTLV